MLDAVTSFAYGFMRLEEAMQSRRRLELGDQVEEHDEP